MEGDSTNIMCPVCTLYLRPGITLETHLLSHPKQKVIEALIAQLPQQSVEKLNNDSEQQPQQQQAAVEMPVFSPSMNVNSNIPQPGPNQSFIYQQFMSSSGTQPIINVNPMNQQFVAVPTLFNPMICPPYIFQQQQQVQILSGATGMHNILPRPSTDMFQTSNPAICSSSTTIVSNPMDSSVQITDASQKFGVTASSAQLSTISEKTLKIENVRIIERTREPNSESVVVINNYSAADDNSPEITEDKLSQSVENNVGVSTKVYLDPKDSGIIIEEVVDHPTIEKEETLVINDEEERAVMMHDEEERTAVINDEEEPEQAEEIVWQNKTVNGASKACQTTQVVIDGKESTSESIETEKSMEIDLTADENDMYEEEIASPAKINNSISQEANEINTLPSSTELHASNVIVEVDGINIIQELMQNRQTIISKVDDYVCVNETTDNNVSQIVVNINEEANDTPIIMNMDEGKYILGMNEEDAKAYPEEKLDDESMSRESLNIRADERMPPRGELSEQESNGASEVGWGSRMYQECSSGMSTSYDLLARESWDASDCSDTEVPPLQSRVPPAESYKSDVDDPDEVDQKTLNFDCTTCGATFRCPKERRVHQTKEHSSPSTSNNAKKTFRKRQTRSQLDGDKEDKKSDVIIKYEPELETQEELDTDEPVAKTEEMFIEIKENVLCNTCGEFLPSLRDLTIHNKKVHKIRATNQIHRCKICSETFRTEVKYAEHLKIHPLECNICGKNFYKMANLQLHLKRHLGVRPYKCDICSKAFLTKQKLGEHHNVHTGNAPIKCNLCDETFRRHSNLIQHRNRHHLNVKKKLKDFVCPCGEVFHSKSKFNWHKEIHEAKPKSCRYCYEKFIHMASLTRHIRRAHNQRYVPDTTRENENVECSICKGVYLKSSLEAHQYTHTGKKQHSCPICNKEFTTKWNLKLHKWTHAAPTTKPFRCETCQAAFIRQSDYTSHMNSHRSIRPYTCNYCGCKFIRKYNCLRHVREHEEGKSFNCEICNKSFHRSYYLKEHMRVHSGIRPFSCHICGKTSATKSNHNKHMKIHHAREPVSTEG